MGGREGQAGHRRSHLPPQTGLDLIDFQTVCWYETDYSVYVMRQASRRSWRIGQTRPVKVVFMSYRNTLQADALKLVAKKLQSSLAVEGELPEDGLAAYGDDGDDLMMALARKIVSGGEDDAKTMEEVFAQARDAEATPRNCWWTKSGSWWRSSRKPSRSTETGTTTPSTSGRRSSLSQPTATTPQRERPCSRDGEQQRASRGGRRAYAVAVLLDRIHGGGAGQAKGSKPQAPARNHVIV